MKALDDYIVYTIKNNYGLKSLDKEVEMEFKMKLDSLGLDLEEALKAQVRRELKRAQPRFMKFKHVETDVILDGADVFMEGEIEFKSDLSEMEI